MDPGHPCAWEPRLAGRAALWLATLAIVQRQLERPAGSSERNARHDRYPTSPQPGDTDQ